MFLCNNTCIQQNITFQFWYILISSVLVNTYVQGERDVQIVILLTLEKEYLNAHNISRPIMRRKKNIYL